VRGNQIFEGHGRYDDNLAQQYYQQAYASYDTLNRRTAVNDSRFDIAYEYDAVGNVRRSRSEFTVEGEAGRQTQEYWYAYDSRDRLLVSKGSLEGGRATSAVAPSRISTGTNGYPSTGSGLSPCLLKSS